MYEETAAFVISSSQHRTRTFACLSQSNNRDLSESCHNPISLNNLRLHTDIIMHLHAQQQ